MRGIRVFSALVFFALRAYGATPFGSVVTLSGSPSFSDLVLDEQRSRLYLVSPSNNHVEVYSTTQNRYLTAITVGHQPVAAAMSRDRKLLYVTCYDDSSLNIVDLDATPNPRVISQITLLAHPEGVAVGFDGRVLISTIGTGQGQGDLIVYDPTASSGNSLRAVVITPTLPAAPSGSPPLGRMFLQYRSHLQATVDGKYIIGVNGQTSTRTVFVYDSNSATVLRSRTISGLSGVLAVSPDGSKFMSGTALVDTATLSILAQQNTANARFVWPTGTANALTTQTNQGGAVFAPNGSVLLSVYNIAPTENPAARSNISRLLVNDPDNLLITLGLQIQESLAGKMVMSNDGTRVYALSESGFVILPFSAAGVPITLSGAGLPIAMPASTVVALASDQCGVTASQQSIDVPVANVGGGNRVTITAQLLQTAPGGPGAGTNQNIIITIPGLGTVGNAANTANNTAAMAPTVKVTPGVNSANVNFKFNAAAGRNLGTVTPHDFLLQSTEAINIIPDVRVFQNYRNAESRGNIQPIETAFNVSEGLVDMLLDTARNRIYIANSGMNRIEIFDLTTNKLLTPVKVGQLPHSMAFGSDSSTLYVGNTGGETLSVINLDTLQLSAPVMYSPVPFNGSFNPVAPSAIASSQRGPQLVMSDGTLWKIVGNQLQPRTLNSAVFGAGVRSVGGGNPAVRTLTSTPEGRFVLLYSGTGFVYLYDSNVDDYVIARQVFTGTQTGYMGAVAAGPNGSYYLANSLILNESLTPIGTTPTSTVTATQPGRGATTSSVSRPVVAVAASGRNSFVRFSGALPTTGNANAAAAAGTLTDPGIYEVVDVTTSNVTQQITALEGPLNAATGNARVAVPGRQMVVDPTGTTAYAVSATGLSVMPLTRLSPQSTPQIPNGSIVSTASLTQNLAPGGLISIYGRNLAQSDSSTANPLPTQMGGVCVTVNNAPIPLLMTSDSQINAQLPTTLAAGRFQVVVHAFDRLVASNTSQMTVAKYAPTVFTLPSGYAMIYHKDGKAVDKDHPAVRDEELVMYGTGFGPAKVGKVTTGVPAPASPLAVTDPVNVYFGDPTYSQAGIIVSWSGLVPGLVGVNQVTLKVPGNHLKGDKLPITVKVGGVSSPTTGPNPPYVAVQ